MYIHEISGSRGNESRQIRNSLAGPVASGSAGVVLSVGVARKAEGGCLVRQRVGRIALLYAADGDEPGCSSAGRKHLGTKIWVIVRERGDLLLRLILAVV